MSAEIDHEYMKTCLIGAIAMALDEMGKKCSPVQLADKVLAALARNGNDLRLEKGDPERAAR